MSKKIRIEDIKIPKGKVLINSLCRHCDGTGYVAWLEDEKKCK